MIYNFRFFRCAGTSTASKREEARVRISAMFDDGHIRTSLVNILKMPSRRLMTYRRQRVASDADLAALRCSAGNDAARIAGIAPHSARDAGSQKHFRSAIFFENRRPTRIGAGDRPVNSERLRLPRHPLRRVSMVYQRLRSMLAVPPKRSAAMNGHEAPI